MQIDPNQMEHSVPTPMPRTHLGRSTTEDLPLRSTVLGGAIPGLKAALLLGAVALSGCGPSAEVPPLEEGTPAALRAVMLEIDKLNWNIEPVVRLPQQFQAVDSWAQSIQTLASHEAWDEYTASDAFLGDKPKFDGYRGWLLAGAIDLSNGAKANDVDIMRRGFVRMQQSCTACHKRYQPNM
jgi:cytochrome c556